MHSHSGNGVNDTCISRMYVIGLKLGTLPPPNELGSVQVVGQERVLVGAIPQDRTMGLGSAKLQPNIRLGSAVLQLITAAPASSSRLRGTGPQPVILPSGLPSRFAIVSYPDPTARKHYCKMYNTTYRGSGKQVVNSCTVRVLRIT